MSLKFKNVCTNPVNTFHGVIVEFFGQASHIVCEFYHDFVCHLTTGYITLKVLPVFPATNKRIRSYSLWDLILFLLRIVSFCAVV